MVFLTLTDDSGISEMLGYVMILGVTITGTIGLSVACLSVISCSTGYIELVGAVNSVKALSDTMDRVSGSSSQCTAVYELYAPEGYDLMVTDACDDLNAIRIYRNGVQIAQYRTGGLSVSAPFRRVVYEGGAVYSNESGRAIIESRPHVFTVRSPAGETALYMGLTCIHSETLAVPGGRQALLGLRHMSVVHDAYPLNAADSIMIEVVTREPECWSEHLSKIGFSTAIGDGMVTAVSGGMTEATIICKHVEVTGDV